MQPQLPASPLRGKYLVRDALANRLLHLLDGALSLRSLPRSSPSLIPTPQRILLANGAHLGDVLLSTALLPLLKSAFPDVQIGFLTGSWSQPVLKDHPLVERVYLVDHWKLNRAPLSRVRKVRHYLGMRHQALWEIKKCRYDVAIDLYYFFPNSIPLFWQAGIPIRIGYTSGGFGPLLTHALDWTNEDHHVIEYQAALLGFLPLNQPLDRYSGLLVPFAPPRPEGQPLGWQDYLVLHMGTGAAWKEWPHDRWKLLAEKLVGLGYHLVFTGNGEAEKQKSEEVMSGRDGCLNLCGQLSWPAFVDVVRQAHLLIGSDSVAGHVAATVGTPLVVISTGITNPAHWRPRSDQCRILTHDVSCAPCYRSQGCAGMECVREVQVEEVLEAVRRMLDLTAADRKRRSA